MSLHTEPQQAQGGSHPVEWACELTGTALLLLGGLSAVCLNFGPHTPLTDVSTSLRLLLTGLLFAGSGSLIAITPIGRRSGAHLNPAVTLAFWSQRTVHPHDLVGYIISQLLGAVLGTSIVSALWGREARAVNLGATSPGPGISLPFAVLIEAGMTAVLILTILLMTGSAHTARWTPLLLWPLIAELVWQGAPYTGTSLNPARSLGPALLAPLPTPYYVYLIGPLAGTAAAIGIYQLITTAHTVTAKLFHDPTYPSTLASALPTRSGRR
jgi:aquaporin Z